MCGVVPQRVRGDPRRSRRGGRAVAGVWAAGAGRWDAGRACDPGARWWHGERGAEPVPGDTRRVGHPDAALAQALAGAAGTAVYSGPSLTGRRVGVEALAAALADAAVIERATGMLAVRLRVDIDTAQAVLRRVARDRGRGVAALAAAVVDGTTSIAPAAVRPAAAARCDRYGLTEVTRCRRPR